MEDLDELLFVLRTQEGDVGDVVMPYRDGGKEAPGSVRTPNSVWYFYPLGVQFVAVRQASGDENRLRVVVGESRLAVIDAKPAYRCPADGAGCAERYDLPSHALGPRFYCLSDYERQCVVDGDDISVEVFSVERPTSFVTIRARHQRAFTVENRGGAPMRLCSSGCCWTV